MISDKKAYKAMKKIRKYCKQKSGCLGCIFLGKNEYCKLIDDAPFPKDWQIPELDSREEENK